MIDVLEVRLDPSAYLPERAHGSDAGLDLRSPNDTVLLPHGAVTIITGVHINIPKGYFGKIEGRSGLAVKSDIIAFGGVIDSGYIGSIAVKLWNLGDKPLYIREGDKIAQLIIQPCETPEMVVVNELEDTERGSAGFGSTGR